MLILNEHTVDALLVPAGTNKIGVFLAIFYLVKFEFLYGYYSRAGTNQERVLITHLRYDKLQNLFVRTVD